jgi:hypothetical protein
MDFIGAKMQGLSQDNVVRLALIFLEKHEDAFNRRELAR